MEEVKRPLKVRFLTWSIAILVLTALFSPAIGSAIIAVYMSVQTGNLWWIFLMALVVPFVLMGSAGLKKVNGYLEQKLLKQQSDMFGTGDELKKKIRGAIKNRIASSDTDPIDLDGVIKENLRTPPRLEFTYNG